SVLSLKFSGVVVPRRNGEESNERMKKHYLLAASLMMLASAAGAQVGQIKTANPGEPVERHLSSDQTFKEWGLDPNVADDIKRIKVCRVEEVCKMRFKEGETPRTRVRNLVQPLRYDDQNIPVSEAFTRQVRQ